MEGTSEVRAGVGVAGIWVDVFEDADCAGAAGVCATGAEAGVAGAALGAGAAFGCNMLGVYLKQYDISCLGHHANYESLLLNIV